MITFGMNFYNAVNLGIPSNINADTVQLVVLPLFHTGGMNCYATHTARRRPYFADARF